MITGEECIAQLTAKTPSGEAYVMKAFHGGKVLIELLQYQKTFEPKCIIHNGEIAFSGMISYGNKQYEIIIPGTNETVRLYENAKQ